MNVIGKPREGTAMTIKANQILKQDERMTSEEASATFGNNLERFMCNVKGMRGVDTHAFVSKFHAAQFRVWCALLGTPERNWARNGAHS